MKFLVTGGAGFIGSAVCRYLLKDKGYEVVNLDKLTYAGNLASLTEIEGNPLYRFEQGDVCDRNTVLEQLEAFQPDVVMHLAAESSVDRSIVRPDDSVQSNIFGTFNMLECARQYWDNLPEERKSTFRFHHVSTDEVYGSLGTEGAFTEASPYDPRSPYSASKASSDHLVMAWFHTYGLPVVISNCSNNYGPYQYPEKLIPATILNAINELSLSVYGKGDNVRDWLFVEDHARALVMIAEKGCVGGNYNVGSYNEKTNLEVVTTICSILDELRPRPSGAKHSELIVFVKDRPGHDKRYALGAAKLKSELGWSAQECFETGIRRTVQWYLNNKWWWTSIYNPRLITQK